MVIAVPLQVWQNHSDTMLAQIQRELETFKVDERAHHEQALCAIASDHAQRVECSETAMASLRRTANTLETQSDALLTDVRRLTVRVDATERSSALAVTEAEAATAQIGKHIAEVAACQKEQQAMRRKLVDATEQLGTVAAEAAETSTRQGRLELAFDGTSRSVSAAEAALQSVVPKVTELSSHSERLRRLETNGDALEARFRAGDIKAIPHVPQ